MRLWSARIHGDIRLYLDGSEEPVYSGAAEEFFLNPYGPYLEHAGIAKETLDGTFLSAKCLLFPHSLRGEMPGCLGGKSRGNPLL